MSGFRILRHPLFVLAAALALLPLFTRALGLPISIASEIALFALVGLGFNLLLGYTGLLSFGHGAFFGLAAYAAALFQIHLAPGAFVLPIVFAVALAALAGLVIGFLVLRRRGVYFSLLTLAFTAMVFYIVYRWTSFTGGENGLGGIRRPDVLGIDLDDQNTFYILIALVVFVAAVLIWRVVRSPFGHVLVAIRENEQRALFVGYPVRRYKLIAFVLSTTALGLAGSLSAYLHYFVSADRVHVVFSGEILAMTVIGGMGNFLGPPLGALFFILFREILTQYTAAWQFYFGLLFMGFILFSPMGLIGLGERLLAPFRRYAEDVAAMAARARPAPNPELPPFLKTSNPPVGGDVLLACRGVAKRFGGLVAVADADLEVHARRLQALIGPNGAGKTTLFNVVSGMYPPDAGEIRLRGERVEGLAPDRLVARGIARSFQITNLFPGLTVRENIRLGIQATNPGRFDLWRAADDHELVNTQTGALIEFLGLKGLEPARVDQLSYGGQRLLEIGVALTARPRVLLLDEPLAGLAAAERERIVGLIRRLAAEMAVILVEHDIDRVFAFADQITVMSEGRVLVDGSAETVRSDPEVQRVYLGAGRKALVRATPAAKTAAPGAPILQIEGINTYYGKSHILHDVSLEVQEGEAVALLGRNGAGKSSTIKSIMGIVPPRSGRVRYQGEEIQGRTPEAIARLGIGLVPQGRRLFPNLTVDENLAMGGLRRRSGAGVHWDRERIFEYFPRVRERLASKADVLSGGERQMVAIARALAGDVRLLLLDEPFEGLAPAVTEEIFKTLDALRGEVPILIIEHDLDLVLALADRAYVLDRGQITHEGPAEPLLSDLDYRKQVLWL
jgi:ABC-type branched-subunit amino acid transport system ATPase component/ABC-type branched-subunit amino acid transport system permease subunit